MALRTADYPDNATVSFVRRLAGHGDNVALVTRDGEMSYRELADRVDETARRLGTGRRLVLIAGANEIDPLVTYLAALSAGHPVLLVPGDNPGTVDALAAAYRPDVVFAAADGRWTLTEQRVGSAHDLHPDLALLLSTSGSTGSPKLVRLSHRNVQANAEAIAQYLDIRATDRAITTLPMHYCYGLSVIHSHLLCGAGLILTGLSVTESRFWEIFRAHRATTLAGVPYTFDLLDRVGFADMDLPHLRYVTQAGGRLAPQRVTAYAELGRRRGWELFVMYGQTEATARMAYLPPRLALAHPHAIGRPIPGGSFRLDPVPESPDEETGELVYSGPNVMLGYAESPEDLRRGATLGELRTGDLARRTGEGLYEVVGRCSRLAKIFGLRIDLQRVEATLEQHGASGCCVGGEDQLLVAVQGSGDATRVRRIAALACGLPTGSVRVRIVDELPRTATGKPDYRAVAQLVDADEPVGTDGPPPGMDTAALRELFAEILARSDITDDSTFVDLGGDSLSYVRMSIRLEQALGYLPAQWHTTPLRDFVPAPPGRRTRWRALETSVVLRAVAIILVIGSHVDLFAVFGGAHVLVGIAGFNFARFHLTPAGRRDRARRILISTGRIAVPSMIWIAAVAALTGQVHLTNVFLLNDLLGPDGWTGQWWVAWRYWFVEAIVYILVALAAVLSIPRIDRLERRFPFGVAVTLAALGLLTRFDVVPLGDGPGRIFSALGVFWLFALGWAAAKSTSVWQRWWVTVLIVATVPGFFGEIHREALIVGGLCLLVWLPSVRCPALLSRAAGVLASSSLYIYLTNFQVYPHLEHHPLPALAASLAVGILYWKATDHAMSRFARRSARRSR